LSGSAVDSGNKVMTKIITAEVADAYEKSENGFTFINHLT
jgi:uncharacterized hydantoinase/oxoprolinase family protein